MNRIPTRSSDRRTDRDERGKARRARSLATSPTSWSARIERATTPRDVQWTRPGPLVSGVLVALGLAASAAASFESRAAASSVPSSSVTTAAATAAPRSTQDVATRYATLADARDAEGLRALWKANPSVVVATFDKDLEGGLALWEANEAEPPTDEIRRLFDRAVFGARAAAEALDAPILADYAASFVGWDDVQRRDFRDGQKLVGAAHAALKEGDAKRAVSLATDALWKTQYLGDWWGLAMSHEVRGRALQTSQSFEHALAAHAQAAELYRALHMSSKEFDNRLRTMRLCILLERWPRASTALDALRASTTAPGVAVEESVTAELDRARATIDAGLAKD